MLRQPLLPVVPFVEARRVPAHFWFGKVLQEEEEVIWDIARRIVQIKEEYKSSEGSEGNKAKEWATQTTGEERKGTKGSEKWLFDGHWARKSLGDVPQHRGRAFLTNSEISREVGCSDKRDITIIIGLQHTNHGIAISIDKVCIGEYPSRKNSRDLMLTEVVDTAPSSNSGPVANPELHSRKLPNRRDAPC
jgi:hypothetical protein